MAQIFPSGSMMTVTRKAAPEDSFSARYARQIVWVRSLSKGNCTFIAEGEVSVKTLCEYTLSVQIASTSVLMALS